MYGQLTRPTLSKITLLTLVMMVFSPSYADNGICGAANNAVIPNLPTDSLSLCASGIPSAPEFKDGRYQWLCSGNTEGANSHVCYTLSSNGKKNQEPLTLQQSSKRGIHGNTIKLSTSGGSGMGKVKFKRIATGGAKCKLTPTGNKAKIKIKNVGICKVMATKAGDKEYNNVRAAPITIKVGYTETTEPAYKIFVSNKAVEGNLGNPNTGQNPKEWADYLCNSDTGRPSTSVVYKAMLGIADLRYACDINEYCGAGHNLDWVIQADATYYNTLDQKVAKANAFGTFDFPVENIIKNADIKPWTGIGAVTGGSVAVSGEATGTTNVKWITSNNCNNWTTRKDDKNGRVGWVNKPDTRLIDLEKHACNKDRPLYCVEQPQAIISSPELSPINQYIVINLNSPIQVMFNSINPINPATVTISSFTVTPYSSESVNTPLAGTITNNGNNKFTFTPSAHYSPGKKYIVGLTNAIQDNQGQPIRETNLSFKTAAQTKLIFMTAGKYWGDLGNLSGADSKCQADAACPPGSICKAIVMIEGSRYACTSADTCGGENSKDWVLAPATTYINAKGQIVSTTNSLATFGAGDGSGKYAFNFPINDAGGHAWTGFDNYFMIQYDDGKPATCSSWSIGDSGINALGGLYGDANSVYPYAFSSDGGGCSQYTNKVNTGVYVDKQCNAPGGCSKRHLYCAQQ